MGERDFEPIGGETIYEGRIITVRNERFRFADGEEVEREIVRHQGAAAVVAHDDDVVYLIRQPRETVGDPSVLEIPAGRLDKEGEEPLDTARRELAEEIGKAAAQWEHLHSFWSSVGMTDEEVHVYLATGLTDAQADSGENERIEVVPWPLAELDRAIAECHDAKSLIGLLELARRRAAGR
jgi:ADP-ribose pyrophosphatase